MKNPTTAILILTAFLAVVGRPAAAAVVDGGPTFDVTSDSGLYVWRTSAGRWQARLVAGGATRNFEGRFESNGNLSGLVGVALESNDSAAINQQKTAKVDLHTTNFDVDGASFDLGWNASTLCLRRTSGTGQLFLGANATPASFPYALAGSAACSGGSTGDSGLYVSKNSNGAWQLRLRSESEPAEFAGTFDATGSINGISRIALESTDSAWKSKWNQVTMKFAAWPVNVEGVDISIPAGAGACLRSSTGQQVTVYLGSSPSNATAAKTPVDLTNSGACGDDPDSGEAKQPPPSGNRKLNGGHYVALMAYDDSPSTMAKEIRPGVKGFLKRYRWRELEPTKGNYNFSEIQADLNYLAGQGMQLIVMVEDKTFKNQNPLPGYLSDQTRRNRPGGYTGIRWSPTYISRKKALLTALGNRFDSNPAFEGFSTQESAPSLDGHVLDATNYTPEKYRNALIEVLKHAASKMPKSRVFWYMNFLPRNNGYMADVIKGVTSSGVVVGGPDIMPDDHSLQKHTYPLYREFDGQVPKFGQVEPVCYHHEHEGSGYKTKYWTPKELFQYGKNNLNVDYIFWVRYTKSLYHNSYDFYDAVPVIQNNPSF